jgi:hypothetical protein
LNIKELYFQNDIKTNAAYLEPQQWIENSESFVSNDPGDCYCELPLDAISFENGCPTIEVLMCSTVSRESL